MLSILTQQEYLVVSIFFTEGVISSTVLEMKSNISQCMCTARYAKEGATIEEILYLNGRLLLARILNG